MKLSDTSISRPVFASVISLIILLTGIAAYFGLPVRQYPDVSNPVVSVSTSYIGASPATVESTITNPLEEGLNGIDGIRDITSQSSFGTSAITVEFENTRDVDAATQDVTNAVNKVINQLPNNPNVNRPVISKVSADAQPIIWLVLQGKDYSPEQLSQLADRIVKQRTEILSGVGNVLLGGYQEWAMRVWLNPKQLAAHNVTTSDVVTALQQNNVQLPAGQIKSDTLFFNVIANGQLIKPEHYADIIIREVNGVPVRIRDIGWVQLGASSYSSFARFNGERVVGVGIVPQSKANTLDVATLVYKTLPSIRAALPGGVTLKVAVDKTQYIRDSIHEVSLTLFIAFGLVVLVVWIFLRTFRATLIPVVAIPVSIIGAFAGMWALGFSVNVLTLFSLVLAIGLVVDDAIIVLENIYRRQELGESRRIAAINGAREIGFPVLATTATLIAIFVPLSLMQGNVGKLFHEFAVTVAIAVGLSGLVALTLTPMLCSRFLQVSHAKHGLFFYSEKLINGANHRYTRITEWTMHHRKTVGIFVILNLVALGGLYMFSPKTFVPTEDQGLILAVVKAPEGSGLAYTSHYLSQVEAAFKSEPAVKQYFAAAGLPVGGPASTRNAIVFARMQDYDKRDISQMDVVKNLFPKLMPISGALAFPINPPSLNSAATAQDVQFVIQGPDFKQLTALSKHLQDTAKAIPGMVNVQSDLTSHTPQLEVDFKREQAADSGITVNTLAQTLQTAIGGTHASDFIMNNKNYQVIAQVDPKYRATPQSINDLYVRGGNNASLPLSNLVDVRNTYGPDTLYHYNLQRSFTLSASILPFLPLSTALDKLQAEAKKVLPDGYQTSLTGQSRDYVETAGSLYITFGIALIFIYLVLAAQFESWVHPLTILLSVPLALTGALLTLMLAHQSLNLFSEIGIILLIGLVTKNGILMVEYANQLRAAGETLMHAAIEAGRIRFRPIIMTSLAMIAGSLPLALATGAGAQTRQPLGWAVVGGLMFSTVFSLIITPLFYLLITGLADKLGLRTIPPKISFTEEKDMEHTDGSQTV
ncbi:efflux RND transporter permease subunit [Sulfuriferula thiophila]|uniref:efflux RND transporter permease subunit n=1 Tax=Sulfuriferula thiophila TaxID=1781211 RepID=UPI000F60B60E|nr:efflux RND transporter permease subunit [Sulfuriferula thiophila]